MEKYTNLIEKIQEFFLLAKSLKKPFLEHIAKRNSIVVIMTSLLTLCVECGLLVNLFYKQPLLATTASKTYFVLYISLIIISILAIILQKQFRDNHKKLYWFHFTFTAFYLLWNIMLNSYELYRMGSGSALTLIVAIIFVSTILHFHPQHIMLLQISIYTLFLLINHERVLDKINPTIAVLVAVVINVFFYYYEIQVVHTQIKVKEMSLQLEKNRIDGAKQYLKRLKDRQMQTAIYHHDLRHSLKLIEQMVLQGDVEKLQSFVSGSHGDFEKPTFYCDNETVNLILGSFNQLAEEQDTIFKSETSLPEELPIADIELCSLLSNLLENALNGAITQKNKEFRYVFIKAIFNNEKLVISVENNFSGEIIMKNGKPLTTKQKDCHGYGIQSIIDITKRYEGIYTFEAEEEVFHVKILLHL